MVREMGVAIDVTRSIDLMMCEWGELGDVLSSVGDGALVMARGPEKSAKCAAAGVLGTGDYRARARM